MTGFTSAPTQPAKLSETAESAETTQILNQASTKNQQSALPEILKPAPTQNIIKNQP
jgi:hypothetical protein